MQWCSAVLRFVFVSLMIAVAAVAHAQAIYPTPVQGDIVLKEFHFESGETMRDLKLHYRTVGRPVRDARGVVTNAVLVLHGTGGTGAQFIRPEFADRLFACTRAFRSTAIAT
jgi:homoserine O-acetyltransferase